MEATDALFHLLRGHADTLSPVVSCRPCTTYNSSSVCVPPLYARPCLARYSISLYCKIYTAPPCVCVGENQNSQYSVFCSPTYWILHADTHPIKAKPSRPNGNATNTRLPPPLSPTAAVRWRGRPPLWWRGRSGTWAQLVRV